MADFTVWRIHECNRDFLKRFLGDKKRLIFWLCAFFLIFWTKVPVPADESAALIQSLKMTVSGMGAYLTLIMTCFIANRLFGRDTEILAGWILLTCPGFLLFARFGFLQPLAAAFLLVTAVYFSAYPRMTADRSFLFGLSCGVITLLRTIFAGILLPLAVVWLLRPWLRRNDPQKGARPAVKILCFLLGTSIIVIPMIWCPMLPNGQTAMAFSDWYGVYMLEFRNIAPILQYSVIFAASAPWLWLLIPSLESVHQYLTADRMDKNTLMLPVLAVAVCTVCSGSFFGFGAALPCFAVITAWGILQGFDKTAWQIRWDKILLKVCNVLFGWIVPIAFLLTPFLLMGGIYPKSVPVEDVALYGYIRFPLAGILMLLWNIVIAVRCARKCGNWFSAAHPEPDRLIPQLYAAMLILMP